MSGVYFLKFLKVIFLLSPFEKLLEKSIVSAVALRCGRKGETTTLWSQSSNQSRIVLIRNPASNSVKCKDKTLRMADGCRHVFHNFHQSAHRHATTVILKQAITTSLHTLTPSLHSTVYTDKILNCCMFLERSGSILRAQRRIFNVQMHRVSTLSCPW